MPGDRRGLAEVLEVLDSGPGTYVLVIEVRGPVRLTVGRLGAFCFQSGTYLYVGSALGGLRRRIQRHLWGGKLHWHIDYLLRIAGVSEIWTIQSVGRLECDVARLLAGVLDVPALGFGASDCACPAHLFYLAGGVQTRCVLEMVQRVHTVRCWRPDGMSWPAPPGR